MRVQGRSTPVVLEGSLLQRPLFHGSILKVTAIVCVVALWAAAAVVGIGQTTYYKHGGSPDSEFKLALMAIVNACKDAGISPHDVDGFASYGNDRSDAPRLASALGCKEFRFSNMFWGGGGGGVCGASSRGAGSLRVQEACQLLGGCATGDERSGTQCNACTRPSNASLHACDPSSTRTS